MPELPTQGYSSAETCSEEIFSTTEIISVVNKEGKCRVRRLPSHALLALPSAYIRRASRDIFIDHLKLYVGLTNSIRPYLLFFPAILACAWCYGMRLALVAIALSAVAVHVWVLAPDPIWTVTLTAGVQVIAFVAVTIVMSLGQSALGIGQQQVPEFMCIRERRGSSTWAGNRQRRFAYFA